jgi:DNA-directed RNA polymerase subunit RPC12/RpoP
MQFVPIRSFDSYITANIWLGKLQQEGIDCYLKDEFTVTIDPILSNAIGGIKLCVNEDQLQASLDLVTLFEEEARQSQKCPKCGSLNVQYISQPNNATNWFTALLSWFFGSYAVSGKYVYHCFNCGNEFDEIADNIDTTA